MRRLLATVTASLLILGVGPAVPATSAVAVRSAVPAGAVSVSITCTIEPSAAEGAWITAFAVDADQSGSTEASVAALGWWNDGRLQVEVNAAGVDASAPPVEVVTIGHRYRVTLSATWGGAHRTWPATLRTGCGTTAGTMTGLSAVVDGRDVSAGRTAARIVTAGAREFDEGLSVHGATVVRGTVAIDAAYLLGVFSAREGILQAVAPDGTIARETGLSPSIFVRSGFGGRWRFEAARAVSDDPYLVTALAFD